MRLLMPCSYQAWDDLVVRAGGWSVCTWSVARMERGAHGAWHAWTMRHGRGLQLTKIAGTCTHGRCGLQACAMSHGRGGPRSVRTTLHALCRVT